MCGICGEIRFDGSFADVAAVDRMNTCHADRGPDGTGTVATGRVAFAHRRLKIIDLAATGAQPMYDVELGLTVVFNGCIYNYPELRETLRDKGYRFFSTSDTEVILKAYHAWGTGCVDRFKGMFAFAIHERDSGRVVLARDRLGIKPMYLVEGDGFLRFSSTLPALLRAGGVDTSIDVTSLHHYLSFHSIVPPPRTILRGVQKLPPATIRVIEADGTSRETRYWDAPFARSAERRDWDTATWREALLDSLRTAVKRRMVADVPVGVLLSGGIDSSIVVALLAELGQTDLATFSIGFQAAGGESGDEFEYSRLVAREFGTDHHEIPIDDARLVPALDGCVAAMNEPMVSHDCVAFYLLSEDVSRHITVVQSGQGADEVLGGYSWYPPLAGVPRGEVLDAYRDVFFDRPHEDVLRLLQPQWHPGSPGHPGGDVSRAYARDRFDGWGEAGAATAVDAALRLDTEVMLVDDPVKRVDSMTMAWGLEARVPFLDHDFVELAATVPPELKLGDGGKKLLKLAARGVVPDAVIDRRKGHFPVPAIRQLDGPYLERVREALTDPRAVARDLYRPAAVERMLADPNATRTALDSNALWQLALLEMWLQTMGV